MDSSDDHDDVKTATNASWIFTSIDGTMAETHEPLNTKLQAAMKRLASSVVPCCKPDDDRRLALPNTVFISRDFESDEFTKLKKRGRTVLGPPALLYYAEISDPRGIPKLLKRPVYNLAMRNVVAVFSGYDNSNSADLQKLVNLVHNMGGKVRENVCGPNQGKTTHLITRSVVKEKYQTAINLGIPVVNENWIASCWARRDEELNNPPFDAAAEECYGEFRVKPFFGLKIHLIGFDEPTNEAITIQEHEGCLVDTAEDATHIVVHETEEGSHKVEFDELGSEKRKVKITCKEFEEEVIVTTKQFLVRAEWYWDSIQINICANPSAFLLFTACPSSAGKSADRKRKTPTTSSHRRRSRLRLSTTFEESSSRNVSFDRSDDSLNVLEPVACALAPSKRYQNFTELCETEQRYVAAMESIQKIIAAAGDKTQPGGALLTDDVYQQLKQFFVPLDNILAVHKDISRDFEKLSSPWQENGTVGDVLPMYLGDMEVVYPPFVRGISEVKAFIGKCAKNNHRFRAFLEGAAKIRPEYGANRQHVTDLVLRPVQRIASVKLILIELIRHTLNSNPDRAGLEKTLAGVERLLAVVNNNAEDLKVKTVNTPKSLGKRARKMSGVLLDRMVSFGKSSGKKLNRAVSTTFLSPMAGRGKDFSDSDGELTPSRLPKR